LGRASYGWASHGSEGCHAEARKGEGGRSIDRGASSIAALSRREPRREPRRKPRRKPRRSPIGRRRAKAGEGGRRRAKAGL
jgi:hypothetical protein